MYTEEYFREVCERIKSQGFRVFVCTSTGYLYGYFSDGKGIGYFQLEWDGYDGTSLCTVNAAGSGCSGYSVKGESGGFTLEELTEEVLRQAFVAYPSWVNALHKVRCIKYRDLEHFLNEYWDKENLKEI